MKAIVVEQHGGPEQLRYKDVAEPAPGPGQALVKVAASGVNYIDVYFRTGLYKAELPLTPGMEAAGTVAAVGAGVTEVAPGDRVAYAMAQGSYAEYAVVPAWKLAKLPDGVDFPAGAAAMLQGMTAHYLTHSTFALKQGDTALVHAAAGGAGQLIIQMAKMRGARVFGTVSTPGEGRHREGSRRGRGDPLHRAGFRGRVQTPHGRARRGRGLRFGRRHHLHQEPEQPAPARHDGALRAGQRAGSAVRSQHPQPEGRPVPHPPKPGTVLRWTATSCCGVPAMCWAGSRLVN